MGIMIMFLVFLLASFASAALAAAGDSPPLLRLRQSAVVPRARSRSTEPRQTILFHRRTEGSPLNRFSPALNKLLSDIPDRKTNAHASSSPKQRDAKSFFEQAQNTIKAGWSMTPEEKKRGKIYEAKHLKASQRNGTRISGTKSGNKARTPVRRKSHKT